MTNLIIDTNVLIYALDASSGFHQSAVNILRDSNYQLFIPSKVITEYFAVCSKLDIPTLDTIQFFRELSQNASILFPNPSSLSTFETLIQKYEPRGNRVFDLEIASVGIANQVLTIATANISDFQAINELNILEVEKTAN